MSFASAALLLFLVIAPIGNIPFVLAALKKVAPENKKRILIREFIIGLFFLLSFLFFGNSILKILSIEPSCLGIAGGIVLFLISLRMIFSTSRIMFKGSPDGEPLIVPLAVPGIAGPSSITTVLLFSNKEPERSYLNLRVQSLLRGLYQAL